jgi:hypothetical protein
VQKSKLEATEARIRQSFVNAAMHDEKLGLCDLLWRKVELQRASLIFQRPSNSPVKRVLPQATTASLATRLADAEREMQDLVARRKIEAALEEGQPREAVRLQFDISEREFAPCVGG